jgi:hypothetical protein
MAFTDDERFNILMAMMEYKKIQYLGDDLPWKTPDPTNDKQRISRLLEVVDTFQNWLNAVENELAETEKKLEWAESLLERKPMKRGKT